MSKIKNLKDFDSFFELIEFFNTEEKCVEYLATLRWNGVVECPYCAKEKCYVLNGKNKRFKCAKCRKQFSVRAGTVFKDSKIPLRKWFFATFLFTAHKKGVSSHQLARDIKVTQKTAWFMLQRIRESFVYDEVLNLKGEVATDETFWGGEERNKQISKREKDSKRGNNKIPITGRVESGRKVYSVPLKNTKTRSLYPIIISKEEAGSKFFTDEFPGYKFFTNYYTYQFVNDSVSEYVRGEIHSNNVENFWSFLK